ncbi:ABC-type enterochelin transport system, periplasmic component [Clostridium aceticum]|uniref:ABC-type enterochelin transport system, periplasmic component n=1 Tax=Clostridium aceticum TaxID=84022 RepID=A0A0D8IF11_9CLOT|nr:siderophore ABC transporter substrate-binding protein [Clostridium aceticum]AKL95352.1 ABC-type enterochelin transport system, periplasmic component [Clostridium aceticum]KJF28838.1 ABC transporter [Clostridium aceticum]
MFKKKSLILSVLLLMISVVGLTACSSTESTGAEEEKEEVIETAAEPKILTITHELGEATLERNPQRVIVFDYATLDSLNQMDIEVIGLPKSNIPQYLEKYNDSQYTDVGTLFEPNYEKIYELQPDLILISGRQADLYEEFEKIAPTVYLTIDTQDYLGSFSSNLTTLGEIFEKEDFVQEQLQVIQQKITELKQLVVDAEKKALIIAANDGALNAFGKGSRFNIIHNEFGFAAADENIEVANHGQSISFEYIVEKNPEVIFVIDRAAVTGGTAAAEQVLDNDLVKMTDAYKNDAIHYLSAHVWYVASGGLEATNIMIQEVRGAIQ